MPTIDTSQVSISLALVGGWISVVGLATFFLKDRLFLSEALLVTVFGIIVGPSCLGWFNPHEWTDSPESANDLTFEITRVVIGIQVLFAGISLPKAYLWREIRSLSVLLLPVMTCAWLISSLIIWGLFPSLHFLEALVCGACVAPTDPVLAAGIAQGRFAEKHVPAHIRNIILAESGANDGLGVPFIFLALYLLLWANPDYTYVNSLGEAIGKWVTEIVLYQILLSIVEGLVLGYIFRRALKFAKQRQLIDHDTFLGYGVGLTLLVLGVVGMLGGDDLLACFVAGNSFTWDDYYRLETEDHSFQDVIDTLLNNAVFTYLGALIPWGEMTNEEFGMHPWQFVVVGILVLLFRRLPALAAFSPLAPVFRHSWREVVFAGWFGPYGVSSIYYVQVALRTLPDDEALVRVRTVISPLIYFLVFTSILVHGVTIPVAKSFTRIRTLTISRTNTFQPQDAYGATMPAPPTAAHFQPGSSPSAVPNLSSVPGSGGDSSTPHISFVADAKGGASTASPASPRTRSLRASASNSALNAGMSSTPVASSRNSRVLQEGEVAFQEGDSIIVEDAEGRVRRTFSETGDAQ